MAVQEEPEILPALLGGADGLFTHPRIKGASPLTVEAGPDTVGARLDRILDQCWAMFKTE